MDYREILLKMNEDTLKVIYESLFNIEAAEDITSVELIESIRKEVFTHEYIEAFLLSLSDDEFNIYMNAVKNNTPFIPMLAKRMKYPIQRLMLFEGTNGLMLPEDLLEEVKTLDLNKIDNERQLIIRDNDFIFGANYLYGYVHEAHLKMLYKKYFGETLTDELMNDWKRDLGLVTIGNVVVLPDLYDESLEVLSELTYNEHDYYVPKTFDALTNALQEMNDVTNPDVQALLTFIKERLHDLPEEQYDELEQFVFTNILLTITPNATMEAFINSFAHHFSKEDFEQFEKLFLSTLENRRLMMHKGFTLNEKKHSKVINISDHH